MNCERVKELLLTDHLDGELGTEEARAVEQHLDACPACRSYQTTVREAAVGPFAKLTPLRPPPTIWQSIVATLESESRVIREPLPASPGGWAFALPQLKLVFKLVPAMALVGLLLIFGNLWFGKPTQSVPPALVAMQRQLTPEELLFGSNPAIEARIMRGMRLDTPMEKLFL